MDKIKIAIVGPGLIGKRHIDLVNVSQECELACIVAPDRTMNHEIATANNVKLYHSISECLDSESIDGFIIASPNQLHAEHGRICIEAGIPALIEKPITSTIDEGFVLADIAEQHNAKILVGHHRAHSPLIAQAQKVIHSGQLGRLVSVMGSAQFYKPTRYFLDGPWRKEIGGGPILINLIHEIGNLRALCGEIAAVQAISSTTIRNFAVEDTVAINFIFDNGALGTFLLSDTAASARSWEQTSHENLDYPYYSDEDCYNIAGTRGCLGIPTMRIKRYANDVDSSWWTPLSEEIIDVTRIDPLACQLQHFLEVIRGNVEPKVSVLDGLRNLQVTDAVRRSALQKEMIQILH